MHHDIAPEVRALLDEQAIQKLVLNYSRAVDRQDLTLLRSLYADDAIHDHGGMYSGSPDGYVGWLATVMKGIELAHHVTNHLIALTGPDTAEGEVYVINYHRIPNKDGGFDGPLQGQRYLDNYRRESGNWRFAHRIVVVDWALPAPALWDFAHPLLKGKRSGRPDAGDNSYAVLKAAAFARRV